MDFNVNNTNANNNFFAQPPQGKEEKNIFAAASNLEMSLPFKESAATSSSRINDYDSSILENNAYHDIPDEMLKLEHKIGMLENTLSKLSDDADALAGLAEKPQLMETLARKKVVETELIELKKKYGALGIGAKISGQIASAVNFTSDKKNGVLSKAKDFWSRQIMSKVSKKFNYSTEMKDALTKLSSINSNVDELITMQVPYGETISRYDKLTAYLNKANVIHSQISNNLKEMK